jgi:hypothetical protein
MVNGKGGPASVWLAHPNKEGGGWNPTDSRCRLLDALSSIYASMGLPCPKFAPYAARSFTPHQFGVGVSEGMKIVVHAAKIQPAIPPKEIPMKSSLLIAGTLLTASAGEPSKIR